MEPLQRVENDIARKNYVPSSFKNSCPGIKTLNHIEILTMSIYKQVCWKSFNTLSIVVYVPWHTSETISSSVSRQKSLTYV